jgi:hypothetical protein
MVSSHLWKMGRVANSGLAERKMAYTIHLSP